MGAGAGARLHLSPARFEVLTRGNGWSGKVDALPLSAGASH